METVPFFEVVNSPRTVLYVDYEMYTIFLTFFIKGLEFFNVLNLYGGQVSHYGTGSAGSFQNVPELWVLEQLMLVAASTCLMIDLTHATANTRSWLA